MNIANLVKGNKVRFVKFKWDTFTYSIEFDGRTMEFPVKREWVKEETLMPEMNADTDFWKRTIKSYLDRLY